MGVHGSFHDDKTNWTALKWGTLFGLGNYFEMRIVEKLEDGWRIAISKTLFDSDCDGNGRASMAATLEKGTRLLYSEEIPSSPRRLPKMQDWQDQVAKKLRIRDKSPLTTCFST